MKENNLRSLLNQKDCTIEKLQMELLEQQKEIKQLKETDEKGTWTYNLKSKDHFINRLKKALEAAKRENTKLEILSIKMKTASDGNKNFDNISGYSTQMSVQNTRNELRKQTKKSTPCRCRRT